MTRQGGFSECKLNKISVSLDFYYCSVASPCVFSSLTQIDASIKKRDVHATHQEREPYTGSVRKNAASVNSAGAVSNAQWDRTNVRNQWISVYCLDGYQISCTTKTITCVVCSIRLSSAFKAG